MAQAFLSVIVMFFLLLATLIFVLAYCGASYWVNILAPGMNSQANF
jgi:hypothetical protein